MVKYSCSSCGSVAENSWDVCSPVALNESSSPDGFDRKNEKQQDVGRYVCGSCGNIAASPGDLCHPTKF